MQLRQLLSQLPDDNLLDDPDCTVTSLDYDDSAGSNVGTTYGLIPESRAMVLESNFYPNTSQTYIPDTEGENMFHYSFPLLLRLVCFRGCGFGARRSRTAR